MLEYAKNTKEFRLRVAEPKIGRVSDIQLSKTWLDMMLHFILNEKFCYFSTFTFQIFC